MLNNVQDILAFLEHFCRGEYLSGGARKHVEASIYGRLEREINFFKQYISIACLQSIEITKHAIQDERQITLLLASCNIIRN